MAVQDITVRKDEYITNILILKFFVYLCLTVKLLFIEKFRKPYEFFLGNGIPVAKCKVKLPTIDFLMCSTC